MHYTANVVIRLQSFSGDATGNLYGNYGIFSSATNPSAIGSINIQTRIEDGVDPLTTISNALAARTDMPTLTAVQDAPMYQPVQ